jgi:hypothetical protein
VQDRGETRLALDSDDAPGRTAGPDKPPRQASRSGAQLKDRAGTIEGHATRERVSQPRPAWICSRYSQRLLQPKAKKDSCIRGHAITPLHRPLRILSLVYYSFSSPKSGSHIRKTVTCAW